MDTPKHYTAWLVNNSSALDQPNCDLTVLEDEIASYRVTDDGTEVPVWASTGDKLLYAVTSVSAADGDIEDAVNAAEDLLRVGGWTLRGNWHAIPYAYIVTVERDATAAPEPTYTRDEEASLCRIGLTVKDAPDTVSPNLPNSPIIRPSYVGFTAFIGAGEWVISTARVVGPKIGVAGHPTKRDYDTLFSAPLDPDSQAPEWLRKIATTETDWLNGRSA